MSRLGKNLGKMAVLLVQIRKKRSFVSDGLFYLGIGVLGVKGEVL